MITFLNSGILFLSSALIIPILIYLFAKKKPQKVIFSSIRFIKQSQQKQKKKINLKNILLLLIRILIILFVILAISRPAVKSSLLTQSSRHPKTAIAIIVDNSYSMNYLIDTKTDLEKAKEIVHIINDLIEQNDVITLLTLNNNWNELKARLNYGKLPKKMIDEISIKAQVNDLKDVIESANKMLRSSHIPNKEIYVITDMQQQQLDNELEFPTFLIPTSYLKNKNNISCENATLSPRIVNKDLKRQIEMELVEHSGTARHDVIFELFLDGNTITERATDLKEFQRKKITIPFDLDVTGWHWGYTAVRDERLMYDNRSYFSFYLDPNPTVAVITGSEKLPVALSSVLDIYTNNVELITSRNTNFDLLEKFDNIILYQPQDLSDKLISILQKLEADGINIIFILGADITLKQKEFVQDHFHCTLMNYQTEYKHIDQINKFHPITKLLNKMNNIEVSDFWQAQSNSNVLLQSGNSQLALEYKNSVLWLFDVNSIKNPFLLDASFPVFAYNCLQFTSKSKNKSLIVGQKLQLNSEKLTLPDRSMISMKNKMFFPDKPGIYFDDQKAISVNLDPSESNYERWQKIKLKNLYFLNNNWQEDILQSRYGFELWKYFLISALILIILEMFLVKSEERKV
ncbi:MAG: BatA and WFA domain-containing protein [Candidatus Cloacimonetes bacterium]|nr:BatA and WFA domain-containing protein [Candidatus Cloacimonadota bacterium]